MEHEAEDEEGDDVSPELIGAEVVLLENLVPGAQTGAVRHVSGRDASWKLLFKGEKIFLFDLVQETVMQPKVSNWIFKSL